ncbi:MAG: hypothetical protein WCY89_03170 [Flavobacteriaceae bacterium]
MDNFLAYVDKSGVNTGILYDRVFSFSHLEIERDTISSHYENFIQGYKAS